MSSVSKVAYARGGPSRSPWRPVHACSSGAFWDRSSDPRARCWSDRCRRQPYCARHRCASSGRPPRNGANAISVHGEACNTCRSVMTSWQCLSWRLTRTLHSHYARSVSRTSTDRSWRLDRCTHCGRRFEVGPFDPSHDASAGIDDQRSRYLAYVEGPEQCAGLVEREGRTDMVLSPILTQVVRRCP
jgi:hypothetical protein